MKFATQTAVDDAWSGLAEVGFTHIGNIGDVRDADRTQLALAPLEQCLELPEGDVTLLHSLTKWQSRLRSRRTLPAQIGRIRHTPASPHADAQLSFTKLAIDHRYREGPADHQDFGRPTSPMRFFSFSLTFSTIFLI